LKTSPTPETARSRPTRARHGQRVHQLVYGVVSVERPQKFAAGVSRDGFVADRELDCGKHQRDPRVTCAAIAYSRP
jgi:hypothetical protein